MLYPCFESHKLTFFKCQFKSGQITHFFYCHDCNAQSNWIPWKSIPERYQKTVESWETRAHLDGIPYLKKGPAEPPKPLEPTIPQMTEGPMLKPNPRPEAVIFNPKGKTPSFDRGTGNPETEVQYLRRVIHNLTVHRDQLMVRIDRLQCELVDLRKFKASARRRQGVPAGTVDPRSEDRKQSRP